MSSSYTASAFVMHGNWSADSRKHPALKFLEHAVKDYFDARDYASKDFHTDDFSIITPHAEHLKDGHKHAIPHSINKFYAQPFDKHKHVPHKIVAVESKDEAAWDIFAQFELFANIVGSTAGEKKVKDDEGEEWDIQLPAFHYFDVVEDREAKYGFRLRHIKFIKDKGLVNDILDRRGIKRD